MVEFGTAGIRGRVADELPPEVVAMVTRAFAMDASDVAVARDGRETGAGLMDAAVAGVLSGGADVERLGALPTPALAFASRGRHGVMITASHNPPGDNGIKLFADGEELDSEAEQRIEARVAEGTRPVAWDRWGSRHDGHVLEAYSDAVIEYLAGHGVPLGDVRLAIDCGNGTGGLAAPGILQRLGGDVRALNARVDGHFPARPSKPTPETLGIVREFLANGSFDAGVALDGDADRLVVLGGDGAVVHEDTILAIIAEHYVSRADVEDPVVVTTPNASTRVDERVEATGGRVERTRLGYLHEGIARAERKGDVDETRVVFAGEPWKHIHPAFGAWIDGIVSAALIAKLIAEAGGLGPLRDPVRERPARKSSIECPNAKKSPVMDGLADELPERYPETDLDTRYGIRLTWPNGGWILVRPSGTEPMVRLYAEHQAVDELVGEIRELIEHRIAEG